MRKPRRGLRDGLVLQAGHGRHHVHCDSTGVCQARANATESCATNDDCISTAPYCDPYIGHHCDSGLSFAGGAAACVDYGASASTGTGGSTGGNDAATGG